MCDIFLCEDLRKLLLNKKIVFMGDSNIRALYKDMLCLYHGSNLIGTRVLRAKMEKSVFNDRLMDHGEKTNARNFKEERLFVKDSFEASFYFLTRVYDERVEKMLTKITSKKQPDIIVINSCLWDINRWGPKGVQEYKKNLVLLLNRFNKLLSNDCLVIWLTTPPLSQKFSGGFLVLQLDFLKYCMRFQVMEANTYARKVVVEHGYDVLDIHYHLRMQLQRRCPDGVHWDATAVRYLTNLLLTHISVAWNLPLPHRNATIMAEEEEIKDEELTLPVQKKEKQPRVIQQKARRNPHSLREFERKQRISRSHNRRRQWQNESPRPVLLRTPYRFPDPSAQPRCQKKSFRFR